MVPLLRLLLLCLLLCPAVTSAQTVLQVLDEEGDPLSGATVIRLPDEQLGYTDDAGQLAVNLAEDDSLRIDFLGFEPLTVTGDRLQAGINRLSMLEWSSGISLMTATIVGRRDERANTLPYQVETIDRENQAKIQSLTTADALEALSGVYVQRSQLGGGSPVVRGFEANRVLLVVDGVRMNNAIYRNGHLQSAITVDPNVLERIEVIYGAGALTYGSDAIGGVVHFRTRQPDFRPDGGWSGYQQANFATAANALNYAGGFEFGGANWAGLSSYSVTAIGDLRAGGNRPDAYGDFGLRDQYVDGDDVLDNDNPQRQVGSGYDQYNLLQKFRLRLAEKMELDANFQFSTTSDIPRYDALIERRDGNLRWARWDYGPQTRALGSLRLSDRRPTSLYDVATYLLAYQYTEEDRIQRRLGSPVTTENLEGVHAYTLQVDFAKHLATGTELRYGLDGRYDEVISTATPAGEPTRYPGGGSTLAAGGAYVDLSHRFADYWRVRGGLRYNYQRLSATFTPNDIVAWPEDYLDGTGGNSDALTAAIGLRYRRAGNSVRLLFAQGFRAPNVDDFGKFREQNGRVQVPNPDLGPEKSHTLELAYGRLEGPFRFEVTAYGTVLTDAVIRRAGALPDGRTSFVSRGDTLYTDTNVNAERAWVYGFDLATAWNFATGWELHGRLNWLRGERRQEAPGGELLTLPQDHIPPAYGQFGLRYERGPWWARGRVDFQVRKEFEDYAVNAIDGTAASGYTFDRVGSADNIELTPDSEGAPGWYTFNAYAGYDFSERVSVQLKAENLLDRFYWRFASGIAAPGIDLGLGVRYQW
ncbi:hemoglobin/transferrin/lactoferrin receptor protein [Neolewinella xylanilytica]|uniref:Hemoglobin/transferrin/lactoferrin receptor protein n=1 Tax=Neolewinella xylanilytica TaxID=1514080 RepID=A0A2S6I9D9_9BACT|nr:TonB-dependent receptor [Neolewinella xylanilytica]PPK88098.1 hemoglobin/transferrin/lactoferrin receptor protein [Neolewinella xylanilytica]